WKANRRRKAKVDADRPQLARNRDRINRLLSAISPANPKQGGIAMRRFVFAAAALLALGDTASTADLSLPYKAPIEPPVGAGWSGFYLGLNVGGGVGNGRSDFAIVGGPAFASVNNFLSGAIGGAQLGFNWQTGMTVVGLETDFQAANVKGGISAPCLPGL